MGPGDGEKRYRLVGVVQPVAQRRGTEQPAAGQPYAALGADNETSAPGESPAVDEELARAMLLDDFGVDYAGSNWFSTYRVHHRVAATFRAGNVFLTGDAAHVHSPVGGQGMNTGLQDAHNLACKLADVIQGRMPAEYLDRYEAERRPVALRLVATTDRMFGLVASATPTARFVRTRVLPVVWPALFRLLPRTPMRGRFAGYLGQFRIRYWLGEGQRQRAQRRHGFPRTTRRGRVLGRRLPWTGAPALEGGNAADNFAPLARAVWQVHAYGPAASDRARGELATGHGMPMFRFPPRRRGTCRTGRWWWSARTGSWPSCPGRGSGSSRTRLRGRGLPSRRPPDTGPTRRRPRPIRPTGHSCHRMWWIDTARPPQPAVAGALPWACPAKCGAGASR